MKSEPSPWGGLRDAEGLLPDAIGVAGCLMGRLLLQGRLVIVAKGRLSGRARRT